MGLIIELENLGSRIARTAATSGSIRRFATNALFSDSDDDGNLIQKLWSGFKRFDNWISGAIKGILSKTIEFSLTQILGVLVSVGTFIYTFNWNATDSELNQQIESQYLAVASSAGGTFGNALGYLVCGGLAGATLFTFNEALALYVLKELGEEALEEIASNLSQLLKLTTSSLVKHAFVFVYKNARAIYRAGNGTMPAKLYADGLINKEQLNKMVEEQNKPWSFASFVEDKIESIPNQYLENFVEEAYEEFIEACVEAGYIIAASVDSYVAGTRVANKDILGSDRTVEIQLNRDPEQNQP